MTGITNVDELLTILNTTESVLRYNSQIENNILQNGGTVLYSYNNIIIASEISESYFIELQKNSYIEYIEDLPLKKYGEINYALIDQSDVSKMTSNTEIINSTISTNTDDNKKTDGVSGKSKKDILQNVANNTISSSASGISPIITNTGLTMNVLINEWFTYPILANGTLPFKYEFNTNNNDILLYNNILSGNTNKSGVYDIIIKVTNNYGYDQKKLVLNVYEKVEIINNEFNVYNKIGTPFTYQIDSTGDSPKTYSVLNLPSELILTDNIITGVFTSSGTYNMTLIVSGITTSDSKQLTVNVGVPPIITSLGEVYCEQYSGFTYIVTPSGTTYNILGILPEGLIFNIDTISGIPIYAGVTNLKIKATNPFGVSLKDLKITIYQI
jgi:hypothetical protein